MDDRIFYNAIAIHTQGAYGATRNIKKGHATWQAAFEALQERAEGSLPDPHQTWEQLRSFGIDLMLASESEYPAHLNEIPHPPFALYIKGNPAALTSSDLNIAIVGTRKASTEGKDVAKRFARELTRQGSTIISGLAFGIDNAAHQGCLDADGTTVAVFAGGLDDIYPRSNAQTTERILETGGALVSEYPINQEPFPYRFIARNRIVSGLSRGVVIIEAPEGSGALATARFAFEQNRDVFVVPGNINYHNFSGSHELIRQGATLVTQPSDILESYQQEKTQQEKKKWSLFPTNHSPEENLIVATLKASSATLDVDKIIEMTRLEPRIANQTITFLLLKDVIKEVDGGYTL